MDTAGMKTAKTGPFDAHFERYDHWFEAHRAAYISELLALRTFVPWEGHGLEIGVGTGRFAGPLGIAMGLDPSDVMLARAAARGVETTKGIAEELPFPDRSFDYALIVTTICFVDSPDRMLAEAHRVLRPDGKLIIGFIDRHSEIGRGYLEHQSESVFYREAVFYSAAEVGDLLQAQSFKALASGQTLFRPLAESTEIEPVRPGTGDGAFVVVMAERAADEAGRTRLSTSLSRMSLQQKQ
jgi:ubiquinone/menaquinone biosynthesis C-methylase UbiE